MNYGEGWFLDENGGLVHKSEIGIGLADPSVPRPGVVTRTRTPVTRTTTPLRKIGSNPGGVWESIKTWWAGLKTEHKVGIVAAPVLLGVIIAAAQKKGGGGLEKI